VSTAVVIHQPATGQAMGLRLLSFSQKVGIAMAEEKEEQGVKIKAYFNVSPKTAAELWKWSKAVFVVLLTLSSVSNHLGIKVTREAVENNKNFVLVLQSDVDAFKATQKENVTLRQSVDELVVILKRLMPAIKNSTLRKESQEKVTEIERRIKPLSLAAPLHADEPFQKEAQTHAN
jgi:hypothetical protein